MPKTKTIKALDDLGRTRIMEIDLLSGEIISSKLLRKSKKSIFGKIDEEIKVGDDFSLGADFN